MSSGMRRQDILGDLRQRGILREDGKLVAGALLCRREVEPLVGLRRSAIYERIENGTFPKPERPYGNRTVRWPSEKIQQFKDGQPAG